MCLTGKCWKCRRLVRHSRERVRIHDAASHPVPVVSFSACSSQDSNLYPPLCKSGALPSSYTSEHRELPGADEGLPPPRAP